MKPSEWITRWSHLIEPGATVLDVACGSGRHVAWFAERGHPVTGVDRDISQTPRTNAATTLIQADLENAAWPLMADAAPRTFGAVVVTNYLWRPLLQTLVHSLAPGGVLLYETFTEGNETVGRPSRPDFLLRRGELLQVCQDLRVVAYENGYLDDPARFVQRIAAVRPLPGSENTRHPSRHPL